MIEIELNNFDLWFATQLAFYRAFSGERKGSTDVFSDKDWVDNNRAHILGCMGEIALAKYLDIYYAGHFDVYKRIPDLVGQGRALEIRHRAIHGSDLILRPTDDPESIYVLTSGTNRRIQLHGWKSGGGLVGGAYKERLKENYKYLSKEKDIIFLPITELEDMEILKTLSKKT